MTPTYVHTRTYMYNTLAHIHMLIHTYPYTLTQTYTRTYIDVYIPSDTYKEDLPFVNLPSLSVRVGTWRM